MGIEGKEDLQRPVEAVLSELGTKLKEIQPGNGFTKEVKMLFVELLQYYPDAYTNLYFTMYEMRFQEFLSRGLAVSEAYDKSSMLARFREMQTDSKKVLAYYQEIYPHAGFKSISDIVKRKDVIFENTGIVAEYEVSRALRAFLVHLEPMAQSQSKKTNAVVQTQGIVGLDEYYASPIVMQRALLKMNTGAFSGEGKRVAEYLQEQTVKEQQDVAYKEQIRQHLDTSAQRMRETVVKHTPGPSYQPPFQDKQKLVEDHTKRIQQKLKGNPDAVTQQRETLSQQQEVQRKVEEQKLKYQTQQELDDVQKTPERTAQKPPEEPKEDLAPYTSNILQKIADKLYTPTMSDDVDTQEEHIVRGYYATVRGFDTGSVYGIFESPGFGGSWQDFSPTVTDQDIVVGTVEIGIEDGSQLLILANSAGDFSYPDPSSFVDERGAKVAVQVGYDASKGIYNVHGYTGKVRYAVVLDRSHKAAGYRVNAEETKSKYQRKNTQTLSHLAEARALVAQGDAVAGVGIMVQYLRNNRSYTTLKTAFEPDIEKRDMLQFADCDVAAEQLVAYLHTLGIQANIQPCFSDANRDNAFMSSEAHGIVKVIYPDGTISYIDATPTTLAPFQPPELTQVPVRKNAPLKNDEIYGQGESPDRERARYDQLTIRVADLLTELSNACENKSPLEIKAILESRMDVLEERRPITDVDAVVYNVLYYEYKYYGQRPYSSDIFDYLQYAFIPIDMDVIARFGILSAGGNGYGCIPSVTGYKTFQLEIDPSQQMQLTKQDRIMKPGLGLKTGRTYADNGTVVEIYLDPNAFINRMKINTVLQQNTIGGSEVEIDDHYVLPGGDIIAKCAFPPSQDMYLICITKESNRGAYGGMKTLGRIHDDLPSDRAATPWAELDNKRIPYTQTSYVDAAGCYYYVIESGGSKKMYKRNMLVEDAVFEPWYNESYLLERCAKMKKVTIHDPGELLCPKVHDEIVGTYTFKSYYTDVTDAVQKTFGNLPVLTQLVFDPSAPSNVRVNISLNNTRNPPYGARSPELNFDLEDFLLENVQTHQVMSPKYLLNWETLNAYCHRFPFNANQRVADDVFNLENVVGSAAFMDAQLHSTDDLFQKRMEVAEPAYRDQRILFTLGHACWYDELDQLHTDYIRQAATIEKLQKDIITDTIKQNERLQHDAAQYRLHQLLYKRFGGLIKMSASEFVQKDKAHQLSQQELLDTKKTYEGQGYNVVRVKQVSFSEDFWRRYLSEHSQDLSKNDTELVWGGGYDQQLAHVKNAMYPLYDPMVTTTETGHAIDTWSALAQPYQPQVDVMQGAREESYRSRLKGVNRKVYDIRERMLQDVRTQQGYQPYENEYFYNNFVQNNTQLLLLDQQKQKLQDEFTVKAAEIIERYTILRSQYMKLPETQRLILLTQLVSHNPQFTKKYLFPIVRIPKDIPNPGGDPAVIRQMIPLSAWDMDVTKRGVTDVQNEIKQFMGPLRVSSGDIDTDIYYFKVEMLRRLPDDERLACIDKAMQDMLLNKVPSMIMSLDELRQYIDDHDKGPQTPAGESKRR